MKTTWRLKRTIFQTSFLLLVTFDRAIFAWPWKMVSANVRYLVYQPMDEKIKTWPLCFPAKKTLIWRRHCSIGQSCCSMTSKWSMKFFHPSVRLTSQKPRAFVSFRWTNQIDLLPSVCCFCFVRVFPFQGHKKITLLVLLTKRTRQPWHSSLKGTASWCVMAVYSILLVIKLTFTKKYHFQFKLLNNRDHIKKLTGWAVWSKNPSCNPFQSALIFAHPGLLLSVFPV